MAKLESEQRSFILESRPLQFSYLYRAPLLQIALWSSYEASMQGRTYTDYRESKKSLNEFFINSELVNIDFFLPLKLYKHVEFN